MKRSFLAGLLFITRLGISSCGETESYDDTNRPDNLRYSELFKENSVFYNKIGEKPSIDPNSSILVGSLIDEAEKGFVVAVKEWTVSVFYVDLHKIPVDRFRILTLAPQTDIDVELVANSCAEFY